MTMPTFTQESVNDNTDPAPPVDTDAEYTCRVCGVPLVYSGRGRKPTLCDDHKRGAAKTTTAGKTSVRSSAKNEALARDAATALCNTHSMVGIGAAFVGYTDTAGVIDTANQPFYDAAVRALSTSPDLCRRIISSGAGSGNVAFIMAYGMFLSAVIPAAVNERRDKIAARELDNPEVTV